MKAIHVTGPRQLQLTDVPVPEPGDGEVLVKLEALSVCGTDMAVNSLRAGPEGGAGGLVLVEIPFQIADQSAAVAIP